MHVKTRGTTGETVQYDAHTWTIDAGPNAMGYYKLSRKGATRSAFEHSAYVHGSDLRFQPEPTEVMEVVDALYGVYLGREGNAGDAEVATVRALETLGWGYVRAYHATSHTASAHR